MNEKTYRYEVVIVGGGAAGLAAGLMLGRSRRSTLVIDEGRPRNAPAAAVHGYLSREGIAPSELVAAGRAEVSSYGVGVIDDRALTARRTSFGFEIDTADGTRVEARRLLVASGLTDQLPKVPGLAERWGRDVLHCPYCHGWEARDRAILVLGTGPMSMHQAQMFRQLSDRVTLLRHDAPEPDSDQRNALQARGIRIVDARAARLEVVDDAVAGIRTEDGELIGADVVALGSRVVPNSAVLDALGVSPVDHPSGAGSMVPADERGRTTVPGVYVAGNVTDPMAQVSAAAARGAWVGAMINADLIEDEIAAAVAAQAQTEVSSR